MYCYQYQSFNWVSESPINCSEFKPVLGREGDRETIFLVEGLFNIMPLHFKWHPAMAHLKSFEMKSFYKAMSEAYPSVDAHGVNLDLAVKRSGKSDFDLYEWIAKEVKSQSQWHKKKKTLHLLGLGDVGSTLSIGLKLLGGETIEKLGIFDLNSNQIKRWEMELNQLDLNHGLKVKGLNEDQLFACDLFVFCASQYVPAVGEQVSDVRMIQYEKNAKIIELYARQAREKQFKGIFCVVSDPVDLLCKKVFDASNRNAQGEWDGQGLLPEQVRGYGLGVMQARAIYYAERMNLPSYLEEGRAFGPHGKSLVVANSLGAYDDCLSKTLTHSVVTSNLEMRGIGYKPFIAPAISSGALSIIRTITAQWHESAYYLGDTFWGARNRLSPYGLEFETLEIPEKLLDRMESTYNELGTLWDTLNV